MDNAAIYYDYVTVNEVELYTAKAGNENAPLVILLHGFPEYHEAWVSQICELANAGYRVWAPDQRGYNLSSKPEGIDAYHINHLTSDIAALIDAAKVEAAHVIGHDWGGTVTWWMTQQYPEKLKSAVILNSPHPAAMQKRLKNSWSQKRKSWYLPFFRVPVLPEISFKLFGVRKLRKMGHAFKTMDMSGYKEAFSQPGALKAMIHWYRSYLKSKGMKHFPEQHIDLPTLLLWGAPDVALDKELGPMSLEYLTNGSLEVFPDASHFVQHDAPEKINSSILKWLDEA